MYRLGMYSKGNFVLPTSSVQAMVMSQIAKGSCHCGGKCKQSAAHLAPRKRKSLGRLGDDFTLDPNVDLFSTSPNPAGIDFFGYGTDPSSILDTNVALPPSNAYVPTPSLDAALTGNLLTTPVSSSSSTSWLNSLFGAGGQVAAAALAPAKPASASLLGTNTAGQSTIAGIPSSYLLYGGAALLLVMIVSGKRR